MTPKDYVRQNIFRLLWIQVTTGSAMVIVARVFRIAPWLSVGVGVLLALVPMIFFVWRCMRFSGALYARQFLKQLYWVEALKFGFTIVLFSFVWIFMPEISPLGLILGFAATQMGNWFALFAMNNRGSEHE